MLTDQMPVCQYILGERRDAGMLEDYNVKIVC